MSDIEIEAEHTKEAEHTGESEAGAQEKVERTVLDSPSFAALLEVYKEKIEQAKRDKFTFLLVGRTGVGKSSSVNSLMGKEVAPVGDWEPTTMSVKSYDNEAFGIKFTVIDTPGLCDDLEEKEKDYTYLKRMQEGASEFDCLWFVTPLYEPRVRSDEKRAIKLVGQAFGQKVWEHAIIVFTFANTTHPEISYQEACTERTRLIRQEIALWTTPQVATAVPAVAIDNKSKTIPDGQEWLGELYVTVFTRISDQAFLSFLFATADRLRFEEQTSSSEVYYPNPSPKSSSYSSGGSSYIPLSTSQGERAAERTQSFFEKSGFGIVGGAVTGATLGSIAGPVGAVVGGIAGAVVGGLLSWFGKR